MSDLISNLQKSIPKWQYSGSDYRSEMIPLWWPTHTSLSQRIFIGRKLLTEWKTSSQCPYLKRAKVETLLYISKCLYFLTKRGFCKNWSTIHSI